MGVYLSQPITAKVSSDCETSWLKCGVSSMQGWRSSQEDAHNCVLDYDKDTSFFAVYDGHGGHEVAEYTARNLPEFLKNIAAYKNGDFEKALVDAFIDFDATLTEENVIAKLKAIIAENSDNPGQDKEEDEVDVAKLREEANMPLSELIAKYASGTVKNPAKARLTGESSQPQSPYLKAKPGNHDGAGSSKEGSSSDEKSPAVNGVVETNGESSEGKKSETSEEKKEGEDGTEEVEKKESGEGSSAAPAVNGDHSEDKDGKKEEEGSPDDEEKKRIKSTIRIAKKKATVTMLAQLFEDNESDSDSDNDESFHAKDSSIVEDDDDEEEDGEGEEVEGEEDEDEEQEDEEDSEDDDSMVHNEEEVAGSESGCAAVVCLLHKNKLYVANAGDSRAVLCRDGQAVDLSIDHKPDDPIEMERIQNAGGTVTRDGRVNGGLNLSRALGDHFYKRCAEVDAKSQMITALPDIQITDIDPSKDQFLVIACDGIWNSLSSQEVVDFVKPLIKEEQKLSSICEKLFDKCLAPDTMGDGTGCDNMTCIIVKFSSEGAPQISTNDSCKRSASPLPQDDSKRPKVETPST